MNILSTLAIKITKAAERAVKQGHPWVFEQSILKGPEVAAEPGSLCVLFDHKTNKAFAFGLWDPDEIVRIKIIYVGRRLLLNHEFWQTAIKEAFAKRNELIEQNVTGYRAIHGENDSFPGLILDIYEKIGVLKIYSEIWKPYLQVLFQEIMSQLELGSLVIRFSRRLSEKDVFPYKEGDVIGRDLESEKVIFQENGVQFFAYPRLGHKTGFFLDQRPNRTWVQNNAKAKKVLDVFSYVGSFGIHALKGGAESLTSVDISSQAMEVAAENVALNKLNKAKWTAVVADAFAALREMRKERRQFDMVIIDPPSFAKQATEVPNALKQYERLAKLGKELLAEEGVLILGSCSSRVSLDEFKKAHESAGISESEGWQLLQTTFHDVDHPVSFPESSYLKTVFYLKK